ncbi:zinc-ribbon domain-containing protein [[Clostridium] scindens]
MFCKMCGKELDDKWTSCPYCGAEVDSERFSNGSYQHVSS